MMSEREGQATDLEAAEADRRVTSASTTPSNLRVCNQGPSATVRGGRSSTNHYVRMHPAVLRQRSSDSGSQQATTTRQRLTPYETRSSSIALVPDERGMPGVQGIRIVEAARLEDAHSAVGLDGVHAFS